MTIPSDDDLRALLGLFSLLMLFVAVDARFGSYGEGPGWFDEIMSLLALLTNAFGLIWCLALLSGFPIERLFKVEAGGAAVVWGSAILAVVFTIVLAFKSNLERLQDARQQARRDVEENRRALRDREE